MSKGSKISAAQLDAMKKEIGAEETVFFSELGSKGDWTPCGSKENANLFYKIDEKTGIKKFKINAIIPTRLQCVIDALLVEKNRVSWESLVDGMKQIEDFGEGYSMHHITTKSVAFVLGRRDFVHFRRITGPEGLEKVKENQTDARLVIDVSSEHPDYPAQNSTFTRATTLFCATIFREFKDKNGRLYTTYDTITQSNINGYVPSWLVNVVTSSSTLDWYNALEKCAIELNKKVDEQEKKAAQK
ncbi:hypothetical protein EIN_489970 [Entamoeba invadens IP1]|uniref:START domain-containing protein n=1 Tax=Entamoeba invadens IP1 TaxID=370355 RepID=A0A0A1U3X1_ENTIV|nr:hypothetical protein EIN_489970 [Entamoeba invadens IP1]ELP88938.1 hypothetical protein EIN_489970 [Entamoeba invadens IP1]|eukprot:XP_004255709.1 hypothetical protein EIN_489970 [Entamoeba invadens IP1]